MLVYSHWGISQKRMCITLPRRARPQASPSMTHLRRPSRMLNAMGVKYVRMFGNDMPKGEPREEVMKRVADGFRQMAAYAQPAGVVVLIESHGDFVHSKDLAELLTTVGSDVRMLDGRGPDAEDDAPASQTDVPSREPVAVGELPF